MAVLAGSVWINGSDFHYIDESIRERIYTGKYIGPVWNARPGSIWIEGNLLRYVNEAGTEIRQLSGKPVQIGFVGKPGSIWVEGANLFWIGDINSDYKFFAYTEEELGLGPMIEIGIPGAITVDVCWHNGRLYVARHTPPDFIVESYASNLTDWQQHFIVGIGGNAGGRLTSYNGNLWVCWRDTNDNGHLRNVFTGMEIFLGLVGGQRPFAIGAGHLAYLYEGSLRNAHIHSLDNPGAIIANQQFGDSAATGLSHMEGASARTWDSMRNLHAWGLNFAISGPFEMAQGFYDDGLVGRYGNIEDKQFSLQRDDLLNDQRLSHSGDHCGVIAWCPGKATYLAVISEYDLIPLEDPDQTIPVDQIQPLVGKWIMGWYEQKGPPESLGKPFAPGNMEIAVYTANYTTAPRPRPTVVMTDGLFINPLYLVRLGSEGQHDEAGIANMEAMAWDLYNRGYQVLFYWDAPDIPIYPNLPPDIIWEQNAYCGVNQSIENFEAFLGSKAQEILSRYPYLAFTVQSFTTNSSLLKEPSRAIPPVQRVCQRYREIYGERMAGIFGFNNSGRDDIQSGEGGLTSNPQLIPHWEKLYSGVTGLPNIFSHAGNGGGSTMTIEIFEFPAQVSRSDKKGLPIFFDITSERPILKIEAGLKDTYGNSVEKPFIMEFEVSEDDDKDGRYMRQLAFKPVRDGVFHPYIKAWDDQGREVEQTAEGTVEVYST